MRERRCIWEKKRNSSFVVADSTREERFTVTTSASLDRYESQQFISYFSYFSHFHVFF